MLNARTIQSILSQSLNPVSTTTHSVLGTGIALPNGSLLSSIVNKIQSHSEENDSKLEVNEVLMKIYALNLSKDIDNITQLTKFEIIPETSSLNDEEDEIESLNVSTKYSQNNTIGYTQRFQNRSHAAATNSLLSSKDQQSTHGLKLFVDRIPNTAYLVIMFTEFQYPEGLVKLKMSSLIENLKELEKLQDLY